jgi:hypothetical protein
MRIWAHADRTLLLSCILHTDSSRVLFPDAFTGIGGGSVAARRGGGGQKESICRRRRNSLSGTGTRSGCRGTAHAGKVEVRSANSRGGMGGRTIWMRWSACHTGMTVLPVGAACGWTSWQKRRFMPTPPSLPARIRWPVPYPTFCLRRKPRRTPHHPPQSERRQPCDDTLPRYRRARPF